MKSRIATAAIGAVCLIAGASVALAAVAQEVDEATGAPHKGSLGGPAPKVSAEAVATYAKLPDWSGVWVGTGTLFDQSHGGANDLAPKARDYPPYNAKWEARYEKFLADVAWKGKTVDPFSRCYPLGFPRLAAAPYKIKFAVRPETTYVVYEGHPVRYIFTDGRPHPGEDDLFPSWEGHSIGHWEGDTLVVDTVGLKDGLLTDRTGLAFSDKLHVVERIRRVSPDQIQDTITLTDPGSMTKPWVVVRKYNKVKGVYPPISHITACKSDQPDGSLYVPEIAPYASFIK